MRTIKFRAWHRSLKLMFWFDVNWGNMSMSGGGYIGMLPISQTERKEIKSFTQPDDRIPIDPLDCELMQSTGLIDKKGKAIYEGDLLRFKGAKDGCELVLFEDGAFQIETSYDRCGEKLRSWCTQNLMDDFQIIGNIYQNPELL